MLSLLLLPAAVQASPRTASDGTLVLEGGSSSKAKSSDTLHDLLSQEVQVFIFNSKTRVWPQVIYSGKYSYRSWKPGPWRPIPHPQLEALIKKYAGHHGVDPSLVQAVMRHESGFNANAVSPKGAQGLMQLMPGTAALMGVNNPLDPEQNIAGGVGYLRRCLDRFGHNVPLAVAAYNAGPESVARYGTVPPYAETQTFVHNVLGSYSGGVQWNGQLRPQKKATANGKGVKSPNQLTRQVAVKAGTAEEAAAKPRPRPKIIEVRSSKSKLRASRPVD
ncbi:MAG: lytic transglycosylase domain-containing protein [Deltaproteobacteria bacterium]|nr:lytic transglycosylase domain-containing protein [Deltaproteobacteria bacterium]